MESELTDLFLKTLLFSDDASPTDRPFIKFVEGAQLEALAKDDAPHFSWDEPVSVAGTPLEKSSVDRSKASRRGMIRFEKTFNAETGETWVHGYNWQGENVYSNVLVEAE